LDQQIVNAEVKKKVEKDHVDEAREKDAKQFEHGYQLLIEEIKKNAIEGFCSKDENNKPIPVEGFEIAKDNMKAIKKMITEGAISEDAINNICGFSTDVQLLFYEKGISFYDQALYEKSIDSFVFLTLVNPHVQSFWIGLALSYEKNLNFNQAIEGLEAATECDPNDFNPYYGLLRCCEAIKDFSKLKELLETAKDNDAIKAPAADLLEYLQSK
jgi:tetratricopeptide (TPR) repeat protein